MASLEGEEYKQEDAPCCLPSDNSLLRSSRRLARGVGATGSYRATALYYVALCYWSSGRPSLGESEGKALNRSGAPLTYSLPSFELHDYRANRTISPTA